MPSVSLETLQNVKSYMLILQSSVCEGIESLEDSSNRFIRDEWKREAGGGGITCVLEGGETFEKAGVNFSHVMGNELPASATASRPELAGRAFHATGASIVVHPKNPYVPTSHANVRYFYAPAISSDETDVWWFGGGFDLTPYYGFKQDAIDWHKSAKSACDPFGPEIYESFKSTCDKYFFIKHRNEPRGIGGLFFDDYSQGGFEKAFALTQSIGDQFSNAYLPIVARRKGMNYGERELSFQAYRRGRYVEFNLVYDRGTLFGLQSGGRTESILMSLPSNVSWKYNYSPEPGSPEADLYETFLKPVDWINESP